MLMIVYVIGGENRWEEWNAVGEKGGSMPSLRLAPLPRWGSASGSARSEAGLCGCSLLPL